MPIRRRVGQSITLGDREKEMGVTVTAIRDNIISLKVFGYQEDPPHEQNYEVAVKKSVRIREDITLVMADLDVKTGRVSIRVYAPPNIIASKSEGSDNHPDIIDGRLKGQHGFLRKLAPGQLSSEARASLEGIRREVDRLLDPTTKP